MTSGAEHLTPGQLVAELLERKGWTQQTLSIVLRKDNGSITRILSGKMPVKAETAIALGEVFGVDPHRFLELQAKFELAQAKLTARPDPGRAQRAHLFGGLPIPAMIKRGWIQADSAKNVAQVEAALTRFFGVKSVDEIEILPHAARKTDVFGEATPVQLAWLYRVRQIAQEMMAPRFSMAMGRSVVGKLSALLASAEEIRKVPRLLTEAGIRFVLVESLPGAKIDGVCFWLDDESPVIGMTCRYDRIDNFWFVLRHELEHVLCGHGRARAMLDTELEGSRAGTDDGLPEEERVANAAAANFCVPQKAMDNFVARKAPFFAERDIIGFARVQQLHPGLVAGQLQHRTGKYDRFRAHQAKIRSILRPNAMTDGWGDVAPTDE
ncbi:MAG: ImmA/IrrE family metallo-endopeptidase [Labilithrix sp.]|nr:ImmA/IrrE family metallo-endopeptidase [Labilithrix sp.]